MSMKDAGWISDVYVSNVGWNVLEDLTEIGNRLAGSEGERKGHDRVKQAFEECGLREIQEHTFELTAWKRGSASLHLTNPEGIELNPIALPGSPGEQVESEIIHIGHGLPEDFDKHQLEGKIVAVRSDVPEYHDHWMHRTEKYYMAVERGAIGFVFQNHVPGCLPPTGSLGNDREIMGPIPAVGISKEDGDRLARYAARGTVRGIIDISVETAPGESRNVIGELGPDTDEEIIVGAHVDGHDISQAAIDNGAGTAIVCELARTLSRIEDRLETRVRFIGFGGEEMGLVGSCRYADQHDTSNVKFVLNCDGIGRGRDLKIHTNEFDRIPELVQEVADETRHPIHIVPEIVYHSDHWPFVWRGIPGVMAMSKRHEKGRGFAHTSADTLDKVDVREIREHTILATMLLLKIAESDRSFPRKTSDEVRESLIEQGLDEVLIRSNEWPYETE